MGLTLELRIRDFMLNTLKRTVSMNVASYVIFTF